MTDKKLKRKVERRPVAKVINVQPPRPAEGLFNPFAEAKAAERASAESHTPVPQHRTTEAPQPQDFKEQSESITEVPQYRGTVVPETNFYKKANEVPDHLARQLTGAESKVLEQIIRLTVGFHRDERQVRVSVLQARTGYGSDKTVRTALQGLE